MQNDIKNEASRILAKEIQSVMFFKDSCLTEREASAIVEWRKCRVEITHDGLKKLWSMKLFMEDDLVFTKTSAESNRQGVVLGIWSFISTVENVPWVEIQRGRVWSSENVILDYLFWLKLNCSKIEHVRKLILMKVENETIH